MVEKNRVEASAREVLVRVDVVVVGDGRDALLGARLEEDLVRDRAGEGSDSAPLKSASVRNRPASEARTASTSRNSKYGIVTESAARRAGVSSMPDSPMSKSPRSTDWSIDW